MRNSASGLPVVPWFRSSSCVQSGSAMLAADVLSACAGCAGVSLYPLRTTPSKKKGHPSTSLQNALKDRPHFRAAPSVKALEGFSEAVGFLLTVTWWLRLWRGVWGLGIRVWVRSSPEHSLTVSRALGFKEKTLHPKPYKPSSPRP